MSAMPPQPVTMPEIAAYPVYFRLFVEMVTALFGAQDRAYRREEGVTFGDAIFNIIRSVFLSNRLMRYRRPVRFGDVIVMDSTLPPIPSPALSRRLANYVNHLDMTRTPSGIVSISTTNCCPYSCSFCSTSARKSPEGDLDEKLLKKTISQVEDLGVPMIILHGGEPLFRYDRFLRLVTHVRPETCLWMFTTGYGLTDERANELKENGLFGAWVSLDHYDPEFHNRQRGHPDAFDNAVRAVERFKKAGVYTCLSLVPPEELEDPAKFKKYYDFAKELGVAEIRVMETKPSGREACRGVKPHSPLLADLHKQLYYDRAYSRHPQLSGLSTWMERDEALGCQCRFEYLFITSTGDVQPCEATEISFGNICQEDFLKVYERACRAFPRPSTGCIPMVMYPEVRDYVKARDSLSSPARGELASTIMEGFRAKGKLPWAAKFTWSTYERRLRAYRRRQAQAAERAEHSASELKTTVTRST